MKKEYEKKINQAESNIYDIEDELDSFNDYTAELSKVKAEKNQLK